MVNMQFFEFLFQMENVQIRFYVFFFMYFDGICDEDRSSQKWRVSIFSIKYKTKICQYLLCDLVTILDLEIKILQMWKPDIEDQRPRI